MSLKPRISIRALLLVVAACCVAARVSKPWLYPNRIPGRRIALIGPMDIDRDGGDDRARLAAMVRRNGGTVDFDLPVAGPASGVIEPRTTWYVAVEPPFGSSIPARFMKAKADAVAEARLNGVQPLTLERLLARLGR